MSTLRPSRSSNPPSPAARWLAAGLWLLAGLSASYWGLRWWGSPALVPVPQLAPERVGIEQEAVARALGEPSGSPAAPAEAAAPSRHQLLGVVRDAQGRGAALIASDGQPARPYRVGAALPDGLVLRELGPREALLGPDAGGSPQRLSLPAKP
jgi:general secretion pathway protein C